jgi:hypothetical protein
VGEQAAAAKREKAGVLKREEQEVEALSLSVALSPWCAF